MLIGCGVRTSCSGRGLAGGAGLRPVRARVETVAAPAPPAPAAWVWGEGPAGDGEPSRAYSPLTAVQARPALLAFTDPLCTSSYADQGVLCCTEEWSAVALSAVTE
ncbi:hypothetical protein NDU88_007880 [Pleurodeles waltl]|uniref:Uncharacterized protein n=1 Tax=Pleurodeles waltl TaxID=8319 RepID=A0AAV7U2W9_PLEWA|nr:hypothetical protein NDU88_007880 [Pleurodeles waltl]